MNRLTDNDFNFGPFTFARSGNWKPWRFVFSTGGDDDEGNTANNITVYAFGYIMRIKLLNLVRPFKIKHTANWDVATIERLGRDWYYEVHPKEYGFSLNEGFLQIFLGPQTMDSTTTKDWSCFLPWTQWRHVRFSLYGLNGEHFWSKYDKEQKLTSNTIKTQMQMQDQCPKMKFLLVDFDGEEVIATTHIEEREWYFGVGWFKWLSWFVKPMIRRSLSIDFDKETGKEKGSWKGGTVGTSIDMLSNELHEDAIKRYCNEEHRSKHGKYKMKFLQLIEDGNETNT